ncbi:S-adenosyl-L-methionine-dependent methyltransferases superfamily protein [Rhynchospora pubera]|uniref:S-adenosyl-L-methionine-dependent methyltransferases superfamily protein n=1 Tax=Rhynchospora pubera TaxID=906938 RepID=A0AAV8DU43_9POAL|nr:S-adenosyl-L-methionine-dependent methyltransferases superfamily protein [Rhynchospora pubera]
MNFVLSVLGPFPFIVRFIPSCHHSVKKQKTQKRAENPKPSEESLIQTMARRPQAPSQPQRNNKNENQKDKNNNKKNGNRMKSRDAAERAAYFARREAAGVLRQVLRGDATRRASASIKSLVYSPSVRNKKATFALVCQTLKYLPVIKEIITSTAILSNKWKKQEELIYITVYDIIFGKEIGTNGPVEKYISQHKEALESALAKMCVRRKVKSIEDLLPNKTEDMPKPRFLRINTLKIDVESAVKEFSKISTVKRDEMLPDLLELLPGFDLHDHPLVLDGSVFLQGKASCMVAHALNPKPGWKVIDACAAPGNKTIHLAALMKGRGNIIACELNETRLKILQETVRRSGATNIDTIPGDFLDVNPKDHAYRKVRAILLDPSCSGSGISAQRLDHLLPSHIKDVDADASKRIQKLAGFQRKALEHALSFPSVERITYSTCSVHQEENEDVIQSVLPLASSLGFELATPYPQWKRRGLPVFDGSEHLLRTDPSDGMEGFFVALFVRKPNEEIAVRDGNNLRDLNNRRGSLRPVYFPRMSKMFLYYASQMRRNAEEGCVTCGGCSERSCC